MLELGLEALGTGEEWRGEVIWSVPESCALTFPEQLGAVTSPDRLGIKWALYLPG